MFLSYSIVGLYVVRDWGISYPLSFDVTKIHKAFFRYFYAYTQM